MDNPSTPPKPSSSSTTQVYQDLDRYRVQQIIDRFLWINEERLNRCQETLNSNQHQLLDCLSMLFHANHALLPGFVSHDCPWGIVNFKPNKMQLHIVKRFSKGYKYRQQNRRLHDITGIYLMGSPGSIAHANHSDLDIWICHQPGLSVRLIDKLKQKAKKIEDWAATLNLEVHFFIMDPERFKEGFSEELKGEDCGSAQHYMLLDEFYRTSIRIAGCYPLWWLIPPHKEDQYDQFAQELLALPFLKDTDIIDFGPINSVPAGEFVGAGMWQLSKAIESPYKSVIKLLLIEIYAREYPATRLLSQDFKQAIYQGQNDANELDPYLMLYRRINAYVTQYHQENRLHLIRKCFYIKAAQKISPKNHHESHWRYDIMLKLTQEWQWTNTQLQSINHQHQWKIDQVEPARKELVNELIHCYKFLTLAHKKYKEQCSIRPKEMLLLGHKLYACYDRKAGKIEDVNPSISLSMHEDHLFLYRHANNNAWQLYQHDPNLNSPNQPPLPIKTSLSIIELMCWGYFNKIINQKTKLHWQDDQQPMPTEELHQLLMALDELPDLTLRKEVCDFSQQSQLTYVTFFINMGIDPHAHLTAQGIHLLSEHNDSLSYSARQENLILSMDLLSINSWGEIYVNHYQGSSALGQCIENLLTHLPPNANIVMPHFTFHCFSSSKAMLINQRIRQIFKDIITTFYSEQGSTYSRYILPLEDHFQVISMQEHAQCKYLETIDDLYENLSHSSAEFSPIVLDSHLKISPINELAKLNIKDKVQVFQHKQELWILDENGALLHTQNQAQAENLLDDMYAFLTQLQQRQELYNQGGNYSIELYVFDHHWKAHRHQMTRSLQTVPAFHIYATIENKSPGLVTLNCNEKVYEEVVLQDQLYLAFTQALLAQRPSEEAYPCFITDIDLSSGLGVLSTHIHTTIDHLKHKFRLENKLNNAMQVHANRLNKP